MNGLIIIGYQGIGNSILNKIGHSTINIDFESSLFEVDGDRIDGWCIVYCRQAVYLAKQGFTVCVSPHKCVRKELAKYDQDGFNIVTITPSHNLKEKWIEKLRQRYVCDPSEKNQAALKNAEDCYDDDIKEISSDPNFSHIYINSIYYDLPTIIRSLTRIFDSGSGQYYCSRRIDDEDQD